MSALRHDSMDLTDVERAFLEAAAELTRRQRELEPLVSAALGRSAFDHWIRGEGRDDPAVRDLTLAEGGEWRFAFHGLACALRHVSDGRRLRLDFAPAGKLAFTPEGVGGFVDASCPPWRAFPELRAALAGSVGYDHRRCQEVARGLLAKGLVAYAAPGFVALVERSTKLVPGRGMVLDIPPAERPEDETFLILCDTLVLTDAASERLGAH